jgi:IS1 family transposase
MEYENNLSKVSYKLSVSSIELRLDKVKKYNSMLHDIKEVIKKKTLETQELILTSCFNNSLAQVRTLEDIDEIQGKLADFKNVLITTDDYNYYDEYALFLSTKLEEKKSFIEKYGNILQMNAVTHELANVEQHSYGYTFFKNLFKKMKLLFEEKIREKDF